MEKYLLLQRTLKVFIFFAVSLSAGHASVINDYLQLVEKDFDEAPTPAKYAIISKPINREYLGTLKSLEDLQEEKLTAKVGPDPLEYKDQQTGESRVNWNKTHPLALAICLGKVELVKKFLEVVPDVNNRQLTAWGYRQPYTLAHIALDPNYPSASNAPLPNQFAVIDALAEKGADFNGIIFHTHIGIYENPPLAAGEASGRVDWEKLYTLRARALLYGADPSIQGSCFNGFNLDSELWIEGNTVDNILKRTLDYYIERLVAGAKVYPIPYVMQHLKKRASEKGINLELLSEKANELNTLKSNHHKIETKIQQREKQMEELKSQKTKEAKRKAQHLHNIKAELQQEGKSLNRKLQNLKKEIGL